jgi:hypothetical protein
MNIIRTKFGLSYKVAESNAEIQHKISNATTFIYLTLASGERIMLNVAQIVRS